MNTVKHLSAVKSTNSVVIPFNGHGQRILLELDQVEDEDQFIIPLDSVNSIHDLNSKMETYFQQVRQVLLETEVQVHGDNIVSNNPSFIAFLKHELGIVQPQKLSFFKRLLTFWKKCIKTILND